MTQSSFATRWNLDVLEAAYQRWRDDPASVDDSWRLFFEGFELGVARAASPSAGAGAQAAIIRLIDAYRDLGHFLARLDPLSDAKAAYSQLELAEFGLDQNDLDRTFEINHFVSVSPSPQPSPPAGGEGKDNRQSSPPAGGEGRVRGMT